MEYRFEVKEVVRIVYSNFEQPDEMKKLVNLFNAVKMQWDDLIQTNCLSLEQTAVLQLIKARLEVFDVAV